MSQENVEIARAAIHALNHGDLDAALKDATADFELDLSRGMGPGAGVYKGGQVQRLWDEFNDSWESISIEPLEFIPMDDHVVIPLTILETRGRDGIEVPSRPTWVLTFGDRTLTRLRMYQERAEAIEAVGAAGGGLASAPRSHPRRIPCKSGRPSRTVVMSEPRADG